MLSKHFILCVCLHFVIIVRCSYCEVEIAKSKANLNILRNVVKLTDTLLDDTDLMNTTIASKPFRCVQIVCKFICFNGQASEIARDIDTKASQTTSQTCNQISELRLYNYNFPNNQLSYGFLGPYSDKVKILYLASSKITDVARGAFANGSFVEITLENLKLTYLKKDFFEGITKDFRSLAVVQKEHHLKSVHRDFLNHVKYQIKYLTMQVGLPSVQNLTGSENLLSNLMHVDLSYNNLGRSLFSTTFGQLSWVEHMDLSHSNISYLSAYIFSGLISTLVYLDLSYNKLKTLSRTVFGLREIPHELKIYANDNEWECSCELQDEMLKIFLYQITWMQCSEPKIYNSWSIFDIRICDPTYMNISTESMKDIESTTNPREGVNGNDNIRPTPYKDGLKIPQSPQPIVAFSTEPTTDYTSPFTNRPDFVEFYCHSKQQSDDSLKHAIKWPPIQFTVTPQEQLKVKVIIEPSPSIYPSSSATTSPSINETFGLIWFSKVTTQYYKMEINYNEYGLGCYNSISHMTTVVELVPNMAYTFCMILQNHMTISPFSCKSIHIGGNLKVQYSSAWLTRDKKATGLSLVIFGVVMFSFVGILLIYMLLKHKPILLKGSKKITTHEGNHNTEDIVVMPRAKSVKSIKEKEDKLTKRSTPFNTERRRNSTESVASYESYINTNLYEVIPAYTQFQNITNPTPSTSTSWTTASIIVQQQKMSPSDYEKDNNYITPLRTDLSSADLVNYAEIPYRTKRISNDPLPEIPQQQQPYDGITFERKDYADIGIIYMLDSQV